MPEASAETSQLSSQLSHLKSALLENLVSCAKKEMVTLNASNATSKESAAKLIQNPRNVSNAKVKMETDAPTTQRSQFVKEKSYAKTATQIA